MGLGSTVTGKLPVSEVSRVFGLRARERRKMKGWSMERLADECGIHWSMIGQIERGQCNVGLHNIVKVAAGLDVDPSELVRGLRPPSASPEGPVG